MRGSLAMRLSFILIVSASHASLVPTPQPTLSSAAAARAPLPRLPLSWCWRHTINADDDAAAAAAAAATAPPQLLPRRCRCVRMLDSTEAPATPQQDVDETRAALQQTAVTVAAACAFCAGVFATRGGEDASAWFAAYILEESLSIDNLFVFSLIFDYFQTPSFAQPRVLKWGLIVAVVLRLSFILAGLAAVERFKGVLLGFAGILLYSAYGLLTEGDEEEEDLSQNTIVKLTKQYLPSTDRYDGDRFFTEQPAAEGGGSLATPLLLALVCVELSDVLFAVDSIPAVFGVTTDPFIAFTLQRLRPIGAAIPIHGRRQRGGRLHLPAAGDCGRPRLYRRQAHRGVWRL